MSKITANETHRRDDIADTFADAVKIALIDKTILTAVNNKTDYNELAKSLTFGYNRLDKLQKAAYRK